MSILSISNYRTVISATTVITLCITDPFQKAFSFSSTCTACPDWSCTCYLIKLTGSLDNLKTSDLVDKQNNNDNNHTDFNQVNQVLNR